jgi:hypothetical protein
VADGVADVLDRDAVAAHDYRHVIRPTIRGGATIMDDVFGDPDDAPEN